MTPLDSLKYGSKVKFHERLGIQAQTVDVYNELLFLRPAGSLLSCTTIWEQASSRFAKDTDVNPEIRSIMVLYDLDRQDTLSFSTLYPCIPMTNAAGLSRFISLLGSIRTLELLHEPGF